MKKALFVCARNQWRSPTAEQVFASHPGVETDSAGLDPACANPLTAEAVAWADLIFVMEKNHRAKLSQRFKPHLKMARVICLDIPDDYGFMDPDLIALLRARVTPRL